MPEATPFGNYSTDFGNKQDEICLFHEYIFDAVNTSNLYKKACLFIKAEQSQTQ